jgi:SET domain-containing protein
MSFSPVDSDQSSSNDAATSHVIKFARRGEKEIKHYTIEAFQQATGLIYLPTLEFENERVRELIHKQCARAIQKNAIGSTSRWLSVLHSEQLRNNFVADVSIRWIDETFGYGLFAEQNLSAGDYIGEYAGVVRRCNFFIANSNDYCFSYPTSALYFRKHMIDSRERGNELRYANHSNSPNSESMGVVRDDILHIILRAIKDIPASTEITYDYSGFHWLSKQRFLEELQRAQIPILRHFLKRKKR